MTKQIEIAKKNNKSCTMVNKESKDKKLKGTKNIKNMRNKCAMHCANRRRRLFIEQYCS